MQGVLAVRHPQGADSSAFPGSVQGYVYRHSRDHLPEKLAQAAQTQETIHADALWAQAQDLHAKTLAALARAEKRRDERLLLSAVRESRSNLELLARLAGELQAAQVQVAVASLAQGALDYMGKPFQVEEALARVQQALEKRRLILENRDYQFNLEAKVRVQADRIEELFVEGVQALAHALEAKDAENHVGETATVCGNVVATNWLFSEPGHPTWLNINRAYPNLRFNVVIWGEQRRAWPLSGKPEVVYLDRQICVTGLISSYQTWTQIQDVEKSDIQVIE